MALYNIIEDAEEEQQKTRRVIMNINKQAKKYKRKILEYYAGVNLKMKLDFVRATDDLFIFQIEFVPGTTESKIRQYLGDVKQTLKLQLFQLYRESRELFFVASEHNTFDNRLLGILTSPSYTEHIKDMKIPYPIGFNTIRRPVIVDLVLYLSWLLGGAGFAGKTTGLQCLLTSIIWGCSPEHVNFIIIDEPGNFTQFAELPHISCPVIHNADAGYKAIMNVYTEMKHRQKLKIESPEEYNRKPILVCFIDECVSFVTGVGKQNTQTLADIISSLLRMGRHAKIFLVLATQNSTISEMKCDLNPLTSRIAFTCSSPIHSVTILGEAGADKLSGNGELYFKSQKHAGLMYIKGAFIAPDEIEKVCSHVRVKYEETEWDDSYKFTIDPASLQPDEEDTGDVIIPNSVTTTQQDVDDKLFAKIIVWSLERETVSANAIDQVFKTGARKAGRLIEKLYKLGVAGDANVKLGRKVLPVCIEDLSEEVINFLNRHDYTPEDIQKVFAAKLIISDNKDCDLITDSNKSECE